MQGPSRNPFLPSSQTPDYTRPSLVTNTRSSFVLVEPAKTEVLRGEVVPPWMQPIELKLEKAGGMQVSDLWTHRMRKKVVQDCFPNRVKSKVASVFHQYYTDKAREKRMTFSYKLSKSSTLRVLVPEPEPEGVRFPPLRSTKHYSHKVNVPRPVLS